MDYLELMMPHFGIPDLTESHPKLKRWWTFVKEREPFLTAFEQGRADLRAYREEHELPPLEGL